jgi:hypothetical protein
MTKSLFLGLLALLVVFVPLGAQQEGSVAIAEQIVPASESIVDNFAGCVERLIAIKTSNKDARRDCLKATGKKAKVVSDVSDDASGAANANRPHVIVGGYGSGYYGGYYRSYTPYRVVITSGRRVSSRTKTNTAKLTSSAKPSSAVSPTVRRAPAASRSKR